MSRDTRDEILQRRFASIDRNLDEVDRLLARRQSDAPVNRTSASRSAQPDETGLKSSIDALRLEEPTPNSGPPAQELRQSDVRGSSPAINHRLLDGSTNAEVWSDSRVTDAGNNDFTALRTGPQSSNRGPNELVAAGPSRPSLSGPASNTARLVSNENRSIPFADEAEDNEAGSRSRRPSLLAQRTCSLNLQPIPESRSLQNGQNRSANAAEPSVAAIRQAKVLREQARQRSGTASTANSQGQLPHNHSFRARSQEQDTTLGNFGSHSDPFTHVQAAINSPRGQQYLAREDSPEYRGSTPQRTKASPSGAATTTSQSTNTGTAEPSPTNTNATQPGRGNALRQFGTESRSYSTATPAPHALRMQQPKQSASYASPSPQLIPSPFQHSNFGKPSSTGIPPYPSLPTASSPPLQPPFRLQQSRLAPFQSSEAFSDPSLLDVPLDAELMTSSSPLQPPSPRVTESSGLGSKQTRLSPRTKVSYDSKYGKLP